MQISKTSPTVSATQPALRVGFVLLPRFTLTAFSGFVDTLRLAADEGDRSRARRCQWAVLGTPGEAIVSSSGVQVLADTPLDTEQSFDYIAVVGGLLSAQKATGAIARALRRFAHTGVPLMGLCTGSFVLARSGLLKGHVACVSWFHRQEFEAEFPGQRVLSNQMYVMDRERLTCAGGTSVVHLAAALVEKHLSRAEAVKALRILIEEQPLPASTLQPEAVLTVQAKDRLVHKAMLLMEQQLANAPDVQHLADLLGLGRRQLERRFAADIGMSPAQYHRSLRLARARWMLTHSDLSLVDIAAECGLGDGSSFARAIRTSTGRSPSAYRQSTRS
ncbi:GlxA family transcriptional regulator [Variovorax sp. PCZ-1]|uniref:GlxA family transcriptional regulator n=1 Tax=Variovorax sp. PCZ-1 TaxID=2835533 RepID=UPI001BCBEDAF|nr:GlxA family transcriptional regulator [Variovorax sp. PCZ-1]MBS7807896.1 GlxA family transcriptional regulator [Variovorax sp. PCZ-1]